MIENSIFGEKILYKTHQHWIIPVMNSLKLILVVVLPITVIVYFLVYSWVITSGVFFLLSGILVSYDWYLWSHSWLFIGNQKVTLAVRNGIWSQYTMSIWYRNIQDSAVSKNSMWGYLLKYGSLFIRSSANEGDFRAYYVPGVGKIYAIVNTLSRYSDDERATIDSVEKLHNYHKKTEFPIKGSAHSRIESNKKILQNMVGITDVVELDHKAKKWIRENEESRNHGVHEVLRRKHVLAFLHNEFFRDATGELCFKNTSDEIFFPGVSFPEIQGNNVVSGSPGVTVHKQLEKLFISGDPMDATVLVGWDD